MSRHHIAVLSVVALLALAGCSDAGLDGIDPAAGGADGTPTPEGRVYELPASGETLADAHDAALRAAGSFTAETNVTSRDPDEGLALTVVATTAVDLDAGTVLLHADVGGGTEQSVYVDPEGTAYQRTTTAAGGATYGRLETAPDVTSLYRLPVAPLVDESTLAYVGRDRVDGVPVSVYEVTELESLVDPAGIGTAAEVDTDSLRSFEVRLMISSEGLVRQLFYHVELELDGSTRALTMRVTYRDVGTTTVDPPDWLDEAQ